VAPPSRLLLSDLIFTDYFLSRDDRFESPEARREAYLPLLNMHYLIRNASIVLVDDMTEMMLPHSGQSYPVISHDFHAGAGSDLLTVRWARYSQNHHLMRCEIVDGASIEPAAATRSLDQLQDYLGIPLLKIAFADRYADATRGWDVPCRCTVASEGSQVAYETAEARELFLRELVGPLDHAIARAPLRQGVASSFIHTPDQSHWCSQRINPALLDFILDRYDRLLVLGYPSSVSYLNREAARRGKRVAHRTDLRIDDDCDCVVQAGVWGRPETDKPVFRLISSGWGEPEVTAYNVPDALRAACPPSQPPGLPEPAR
jgi:hypothetical protein